VADVGPRPLFAVLAAHALATRNRATRELGRSGVWVLMLGLAVIGTTFLAPLWLAMLAVGFAFGKTLPGPHAEPLLGALLFGLSYFGGATSGTISGAKQLTWDAYRTYPVRLRTLFFAELVASSADLMPIVLGVATLALCAGMAVANPRLLPLLPLVLLEGVAAVLVVQLLVGALAERLVRRLRVALNVLALVLAVGIVFGTMVPLAAQSSDPMAAALATVARARAPLEHAAIVLPTTWTARSLAALARGRLGVALALQAVPVGALVAIGVAAARMLGREARGESDEDAPPERLWSFRGAAAGVARLQLATILDSRVGRFGLVFPLIVVVLVRGPLTTLVGRAPWAVPAAFIYVALLGTQFQLNQFGLDAHGTKALLLLPIDEADIWRGKARGIVLYQTMQGASLAVFLAFVQRPSVAELASGVLVFFAMVATENTVGRATSVLMPRMLPRKRMQSNATPIGLVLVALFMSVVFGGVLGVAFAVLASRAPGYRPLVAAGLLLVAAGAQRLLLPRASRLLRRRKETLLAALG
jgi:hypothetical protein